MQDPIAYTYEVIIRGEATADDGWQMDLPLAALVRRGDGLLEEIPLAQAGDEEVVLVRGSWRTAQEGPCPDCGGRWVWSEAGYMPGTRRCACGSLFSVRPRAEGPWILRRERFF